MEIDEKILDQIIGVVYPDNWPAWVVNCLRQIENVSIPSVEESLCTAPDPIFNLFVERTKKDLFPCMKGSLKDKCGIEFLGEYVGDLERFLSNPELQEAVAVCPDKLSEFKKIDPDVQSIPSKSDIKEKLKQLPEDHPERQLYDKILSMLNERDAEPIELIRFQNQLHEQLETITATMKVADEVLRRKADAVTYTLARIAERPPEERKSFYAAYNRARNKKPLPSPEYLSATDKMSSAMVVFWQSALLNSNNTQLRNWFISLFGKPGVFNQVAVSKFCERKEIDLGAGQGRPTRQED